jgi:hypothetical protein
MSRSSTAGPRQERRNPLAESLDLERYWEPDEDAMLAALRVVTGLPMRPASRRKEVAP